MVALSLFFTASACLAGCDRGPARPPGAEARKITVAVTPWPASASLFIAHEKGYFRDEGLDATLRSYASGHLGLGAVLSGKAEFAALGETPIARAVLDGKPLVVIATIAEIDRAILIIARKDRGISKPDDLAGKKIGLVAGTTAEFFLDVYLTASYIDPKDIRIINIPPDNVVQALLKGDVDAVSTWAPHTTALQERLGGNGVVLHEPGLYTMTWNIVAARELTQRDPDVIVRFLRAIVRANRFIAEQPAEARAVAAKHCGMDIAAVEKEWSNYELTAQLNQALIIDLEAQARWMIRKEGGGNRTIPNFLEHVYTKGLKTVRPEALRIIGEQEPGSRSR